ncbi:hypothetical protein SESBI_21976 [Sesbania bispinosa]|nr:hypothetical protein SESBI_21976 [Sesbania bispinosa]
MKNSASEDMFNNFSELMNFDNYAGGCNGSSMTDQILANGLSSFASAPYPPSDGLNLMEQSNSPFFMTEVSGNYNAMKEKEALVQGFRVAVFISHVPEWTSNVGYYHKTEYLRLEHAINHEVRGSIALPISDPHSELPCSAVLELITTKEKA